MSKTKKDCHKIVATKHLNSGHIPSKHLITNNTTLVMISFSTKNHVTETFSTDRPQQTQATYNTHTQSATDAIAGILLQYSVQIFCKTVFEAFCPAQLQ